MSHILNTGAVLPSSLLSKQNVSMVSAFNKVYNNVQLRAGVIIKTYDIDNENNLNKATPEYDILVLEQDKDNGTTPITYRNAISMDSFGGMADFFEFKRRAKKKEKSLDNITDNDGQLVLLLCLDGNAKKGIIIGGIKQAKRLTKLTTEAGIHLEGEYNGLNWKIDKDGAFTVTFKGPTDNEGKPKTTQASTIMIDKSGSVELNTTKGNESIRLDKEKSLIDINSRKDIKLKAGGDFTNDITGAFNQKIGGALKQEISGSATCKASSYELSLSGSLLMEASSCVQKYSGSCEIKAMKVDLNASLVNVGQGASALAVLGPQLVAWMATHTHMAPQAPAGVLPTLPPTVPPPVSMLSTSVMIKS